MLSMPALFSGLRCRKLEPERMDDLALAPALHLQALRGLRRINAISFSADAFWQPIKKHYETAGAKPLRVLDIASGAGDIVVKLTLKARNENLPIVFEGCDFNPRAIQFAQGQAAAKGLVINYFQFNALSDAIPSRFDIIINSLFLHHLDDPQLLSFFKTLSASQSKLILISDLRRSLRGMALSFLGTRSLSRSPIVHEDGLLSVKAAFTKREILQKLVTAGLLNFKIKSIWPMRYLLSWERK